MSKPKAIPESSEELAELLMDDKRRGEIFADAEQTKEFLGKYVRATNKTGEVAKLVSEEVTAGLTTFLKDAGIDRPDLTPKNLPNMPKGYSRKAIGAGIDNLFEDAASYFQATWHRNPGRDSDERVKKIRAYSSDVPSEGGFLIPEVLRGELLKVALEASIVRPRARTVPMESLTVPYPMIDVTTNVGSVYGGVVCGWTAEGAAMTQTDAVFGRLLLQCKKLTGYTEVPNELIADSIVSFEQFINTMFPEAMANAEDTAFISGSGVGEPQGVLLSPALVTVAAQPLQPITTIVWENLINMYARMLPGSLNRAVWLVSPNTFPELATMALNVGLGGSAVWLNNGVAGPPATILGRPVIITEKVPVLGALSDISFVDFGYYLIGDRQAMVQSSSPHFRFQNDLTAYKITERVDGRGWLNSAITPANGGPALSPFVTLAGRP